MSGSVFDVGPSVRIGDVLALHDELSGLARASARLRHGMEAVTGLRHGELEALVAVADGATDASALGAATGQVDDAARATAATLVDRGLVMSPGRSVTGLRITEAGRVALQQAEALQIRILDAAVERLGADRADDLRAGVRALGSALHTGAPPPRSVLGGTRSRGDLSDNS
jgi:hypothetical protein